MHADHDRIFFFSFAFSASSLLPSTGNSNRRPFTKHQRERGGRMKGAFSFRAQLLRNESVLWLRLQPPACERLARRACDRRTQQLGVPPPPSNRFPLFRQQASPGISEAAEQTEDTPAFYLGFVLFFLKGTFCP